MTTRTHTRFYRIGVISVLCIVIGVAGTSTASAGRFDGTAAKLRVKASVTAQRVAATPTKAADRTREHMHNVGQQVADMYQKLNMIYAEARAHQPLLDQLRNGPMMEVIGATLDFIEEKQYEYQQFDGQLAETFRQGIQEMISDLQGILEDFPAFGDDDAGQRLNKVVDLIDRMPVVFLYLLHEAVGPQLDTLQDNVNNIRAKLAELPDLPRMRDLVADPFVYEAQLCELYTNKYTATHVATVQALLKTVSWALKSIKDLMPTDLEITINAVAGGGTTIARHPAQVPFHVVGAFVVDGIDLRITNYLSIAKSVCQAMGHYDPA